MNKYMNINTKINNYSRSLLSFFKKCTFPNIIHKWRYSKQAKVIRVCISRNILQEEFKIKKKKALKNTGKNGKFQIDYNFSSY